MEQNELKLWKKNVEYTFDHIGYNIAFELIEDGDDFIIVPKKNLVPKISYLLNGKKVNELRFNAIDLYNKIYNSLSIQDRYELQIGILFVREVEKILTADNNLLFIRNYFQENNFSFIDYIKINNFYSIRNLELKNIKGTKEIYFLGENGDGKSLILMGIFLAFNESHIRKNTSFEFTGKVLDMVSRTIQLGDVQLGEQQLGGITQKDKLLLKGIDNNKLEYGIGKGVYLMNFFAYGVHRGRYSTDNAEQYGFMSLFDNNLELNNPVSWLKQLYLLELEKRLDPNNMIGEIKELPNNIPLQTIQDLFHELLEKNVTIEVKAEGVKFKEKGFELSFEQLSEGYKNLIIWVSDLIFRLHQNQPNAEKLNELTGVVMVDEIELHLHPKWQRTLVGKLRKFFPNIQFIFTTHSPTIIQGASDEAIIYKVYRDNETGHTHVSDPYYKKDLDELMFNSLVTSPLFGLDDARMTSKPIVPDTSDSYALSRINKRVEAKLAQQKKNGKPFISDNEIDSLIDKILNEELSSNDKNK